MLINCVSFFSKNSFVFVYFQLFVLQILFFHCFFRLLPSLSDMANPRGVEQINTKSVFARLELLDEKKQGGLRKEHFYHLQQILHFFHML